MWLVVRHGPFVMRSCVMLYSEGRRRPLNRLSIASMGDWGSEVERGMSVMCNEDGMQPAIDVEISFVLKYPREVALYDHLLVRYSGSDLIENLIIIVSLCCHQTGLLQNMLRREMNQKVAGDSARNRLSQFKDSKQRISAQSTCKL